jgi:hypothetical protein
MAFPALPLPTLQLVTDHGATTTAAIGVGGVVSSGDVRGGTFTLNGVTISTWPSGGGGSAAGAAGTIQLSDGSGAFIAGACPASIDAASGTLFVQSALAVMSISAEPVDTLVFAKPDGSAGNVNWGGSFASDGGEISSDAAGSLSVGQQLTVLGRVIIGGTTDDTITGLQVNGTASFAAAISLNANAINLDSFCGLSADGSGDVTAGGTWTFSGGSVHAGIYFADSSGPVCLCNQNSNPIVIGDISTSLSGGAIDLAQAVSCRNGLAMTGGGGIQMNGGSLAMNFGGGSGGTFLRLDGGLLDFGSITYSGSPSPFGYLPIWVNGSPAYIPYYT